MTFTTYFQAQAFPVTQEVLLRYIALLGNGPHAYGSALNLISGLRWFSNILDKNNEKVFESVFVTSSLKGLKSQLSRPPRQKLPFTAGHLLKFYYILDFSNTKHLAAWCAMLLAFFGCFRLSNLVPTSKGKFNPLKQLTRSDVRFKDDFVLVFYKWSKTNQSQANVTWIPIHSVSDHRFDIKNFFKLLFSVVKVPDEAPLFSYDKKNFHSKYSFIRVLDSCLFEAGLNLRDYSWHSFRRGAAVFAFELGLNDSAVQLLGDWSSSAFKHYLEFAFVRKITIAEKISKKFDIYIKS